MATCGPLNMLRLLLLHCFLFRFSEGFLLPSSISRLSTVANSPAQRSVVYPVATSCVLYGSKSNNNGDNGSFDANLLTGDIIAVVVACQLIGLIDVLNDATFWEKGGFAQSIPAVPSTLGTFVQRVSSGCVCWILSSFIGSNAATIPSTAKVVFLFGLLQLGLAFAVSQTASVGFDPLLVARDCYFAAIVASGWRYFYAKNYSI